MPAVEVEGGARLRKVLRAAGDIDGLKDVWQRVSVQAAEWVKAEAPVRRGKLRGSVRGTRRAGGAQVLIGRTSVPYAGPIIFGWRRRNIAPNPFPYRALARHEAELIELVADGLVEAIDKTG